MMRDGLHTSTNSDKSWYLNDHLHRTDGPAVLWPNGDKEWWLHDQLHRTDGPAVERANGDKRWFLNGREYSFDRWLEANTEISDQQRVMFKLEWT
jgi:hypothetical protein